MKKIFTLLLVFSVSLLSMANTAMGVKASDMHYSKLVGQGADTVSIIFYCPTSDQYNAFMWGYLFDDDDNTLVADALSALVAEAGVEMQGLESGFITTIKWANNVLSFEGVSNTPTGYYWMYNVNDQFADAVTSQKIHANDVINFQFTNDYTSPLYTYESLQENWITIYPVLDEEYHPLPLLGNITYNVGEGQKSAALIIYCPNGHGMHATIWGYKFSGEAVVGDMLSSIAADDSRLEISGLDYGYITSIAFADDIVSFDTNGEQMLPSTYWMYSLNDVGAPKGVSQMPLNDGDVVVFEYAPHASTIAELQASWLTYVADDPNFRGTDLFSPKYTVGEGSAHATLSILYGATGKALTWGYDFNDNGEVMASDMLGDIVAADDRLTIDGLDYGFITNVEYHGSEATFENTSYNWMFTINDREAPYGVSMMPMHDGYALLLEYTGGAWPFTLHKLAALNEEGLTYYVEKGSTTALNDAAADALTIFADGRVIASASGVMSIFAVTGQNVMNADVVAGQTMTLNLPAGIYTARLNNAAVKFIVK